MVFHYYIEIKPFQNKYLVKMYEVLRRNGKKVLRLLDIGYTRFEFTNEEIIIYRSLDTPLDDKNAKIDMVFSFPEGYDLKEEGDKIIIEGYGTQDYI
jgi:hypothetical protein